MRKHILIVLGLLVLVAAGIFLWLSRPDKARLDVAAVTGQRPTISAPRSQMIPTVKVADAIGWPAGAKPVSYTHLTLPTIYSV